MTKFLLSGAAAFAITAGSSVIAQPAQPAPGGRHGYMTETENRADVQAHVAKMFARLDTSHDGAITKAEVDAAQAAHAAKAEKRAQHFDPDKVFGRIDANKDGKITQAEADAAHNARVEAKGGKPANAHAAGFHGLFARADTNKDGVITRAEFDAMGTQIRARMEQAGVRRGFAGKMFDAADTNKDGRVTLAEAQQLALAHFDRADLNHDGKLTPEERQQARQQLRGQHRPS